MRMLHFFHTFSVRLKLFQNRKLKNNKSLHTKWCQYLWKNSLLTWHLGLQFPWSPFFSYSICCPPYGRLLLSILFCSSALSFCTAPIPTATPMAWRAPLLGSGQNTHPPLAFQVHLGITQARHSWLLLSSSGCTSQCLLLRSPSQQVTSPSVLWPLIKSSVSTNAKDSTP